ncbi:MAG: hypothetical protein ABSH22_06065 [Tepidisphaeraceae bacterium]
MHSSKKTILAAAVAAMLVGRAALADTISLHDDSSTSPSTGVFVYDVELDSHTNLQGTNDPQSTDPADDGFVIYDFQGYTGPTNVTVDLSFVSSPGGNNVTEPFFLTTDLTSNTLNDASSVDSQAASTAAEVPVPFDAPNILNLNFAYTGTGFAALTNTTYSAVLTIDSDITTLPHIGVYGSVDNSGALNGFDASQGTLILPGQIVPVPPALLGGGALAGLLGLGTLLKARRRLV